MFLPTLAVLMHPSDDSKLLRCTRLMTVNCWDAPVLTCGHKILCIMHNVLFFALMFFSNLCCTDAPVWWQQIVEMRPSWHVVTTFYVLCVMFGSLFRYFLPTFAVLMHPSDDSKLLRCAHLEMWLLNSMYYVHCLALCFDLLFRPWLYWCTHLITAGDVSTLKCVH